MTRMPNEVKPLELHRWAFVVYVANFSIDRSEMRQIFFFSIGEKNMKKNLLLLMVLAIVFAFVAVSCDSDGGGIPEAKDEYIVSFYREPGEAAVSTKLVKNGGFVAEPTPVPVKDGFSFMGWYYKGAKFDFKNTPITGDIDLYAKWGAVSSGEDPGETSFTVTFDFDNGSPNSKVEVENGGTLAGKLPKDPKKEGTKGFIEWRKSDGTAVDDRTPITENLVLKAAYWKDFSTASAEEQSAVMVEFTRMASIGAYLCNTTVKEDLATGKAIDRYEPKALVSLLCYANGEVFVDPEDEDPSPEFSITIDGYKRTAAFFTAPEIVDGGVLEGLEYEEKAVRLEKLSFRVKDSDLEYESDEVVISDVNIEFVDAKMTRFSLVSLNLGGESHRMSLRDDESFYFDDYVIPSK